MLWWLFGNGFNILTPLEHLQQQVYLLDEVLGHVGLEHHLLDLQDVVGRHLQHTHVTLQNGGVLPDDEKGNNQPTNNPWIDGLIEMGNSSPPVVAQFLVDGEGVFLAKHVGVDLVDLAQGFAGLELSLFVVGVVIWVVLPRQFSPLPCAGLPHIKVPSACVGGWIDAWD